jgi:putative transposase
LNGSNGSGRDIISKNGRHARMHLTLKRKATKPAGLHFLQRQAQFEDFIDIFNKSAPSPSL